jgi:hypothetical protein
MVLPFTPVMDISTLGSGAYAVRVPGHVPARLIVIR